MNKIGMMALTTGLMLAGSCLAVRAQGNMNMPQQPTQQQMQQQPMQQQMQHRQMVPQQPTVRVNAMSKSTWYNAPREIQITDDRPVVHDFREAPSTPGAIALPFGPAGNPGVLPATGLQLGNAGFRTPQGSGPIGLPKSGFGTASNIPASLMRPVAGLQKGQNTGAMGNMGVARSPIRPGASTRRIANTTPAKQPAAQQQLATYNQPGGQPYGATPSGSSTIVKSGVTGKLMNRIK